MSLDTIYSNNLINNLPPYLPVAQRADPKRQIKKRVTACDVAPFGPRKMWELIAEGKIQVVRLGPRKTLVVTASLLNYLASLAQ